MSALQSSGASPRRSVVLLGVTLVVFILERLTPGSLAHAILGPRASPQAVAAFDAANGLNHPVVVQYLDFLWHLLHGNLGYSYKLNQSVGSLIAHELPNDLILVGLGFVFALAIALPLGIAQAVRRNRALDHVATGVALALYSMPSYWLALLLIAALSIGAHLLPAGGGTVDGDRRHPRRPARAGAAGADADARQRRLVQPLHALGRDRHARPGLRPSGPRQGPARAARAQPPRAAQLAAGDRDAARACRCRCC